MMKRSAPRLQLDVLDGGVVEGILRGAQGRAGADSVAILLDGTVQAICALQPAQRGVLRFTYTLPRHLIFSEIDILSLPGGESVLGAPLLLAKTYALRPLPVLRDTLTLSGGFEAASWLDSRLGVELLDGDRVAARGIARRDSDDRKTATWRFQQPMATLIRPGHTAHLRLRIAGLTIAAPALTLGPSDLGFAGCLDAATPFRVEGWAADLKDPAHRVKLEIVVDQHIVARTTASTRRADIQALGHSDGDCGFAVDLPKHSDAHARRRIGVRLAGTFTELSGSPVIIDPVPGLIGSFDSLHGMSAHGWALDNTRPDMPLSVEVIGPEGEVLGIAQASQFRGDLLDAGLGGGNCAFKIDLAAHIDRLMGRDIVVRIAGTAQILPGSPRRVTVNPNLQRFMHRREALRPGVLPRLKRALEHRAGDRGISFIMPVHNPRRQFLVEALESVRLQFCDAWELICVDDGSTEPHVAEILGLYAKRDRRIRVLTSADNVGIARAVNFGLRAARYAHAAFMDHDDTLEPDAAWQLIRAIADTGADLLYSDEAITDETIANITEFRLRPAFSHDYYLSHPYFVHLVCARTDMARRIGGWDEGMRISADVDFVLRAIENAAIIAHVPAVLYRWRTHAGSTGHAKQAEVMQATAGALQRHLDRLGTGAVASPGVWFNQFRIDWPESDGMVLIVIPTKNKGDLLRTAIESIERTTQHERLRIVVIDHESGDPETRAYLDDIAARHIVMPYSGVFNFSRMNNQAVALHGEGAAFVLFLNNDIEATQNGWIERLRRLANRPDVGAVGALLMYADRSVQHAGVILGFNESADHALKFQKVFLDEHGRRNLGYNCSLTSTRDFSAVTAACVMLRREVFDEIGGFDENFGIGFNDTDLCLRIGQAGYRILYDGSTVLYHYESATRSQTQQVFHPEDTRRMVQRWHTALHGGDPWYHPNLSLRTQDHVPTEDPGCRIAPPARAASRTGQGAGPGLSQWAHLPTRVRHARNRF